VSYRIRLGSYDAIPKHPSKPFKPAIPRDNDFPKVQIAVYLPAQVGIVSKLDYYSGLPILVIKVNPILSPARIMSS
jgi:hypothetical protein